MSCPCETTRKASCSQESICHGAHRAVKKATKKWLEKRAQLQMFFIHNENIHENRRNGKWKNKFDPHYNY